MSKLKPLLPRWTESKNYLKESINLQQYFLSFLEQNGVPIQTYEDHTAINA